MDYSYSNCQISYQDFFRKIMKWLCIGLGITTLTSIPIAIIGPDIIPEGIYYAILLSCSVIEIVMVIVISKKLSDLSIRSAKKYFCIYSVINGVTISFLLSIVAPGISILAFALTTAYFGLLYTVATYSSFDFSGIGKICLMLLPLLLIGYFILYFMNAPVLYYIIIFIDLALFTGITLYDIQKIRILYHEATNETVECFALISALILYLDFINIFIDILMIIADGN